MRRVFGLFLVALFAVSVAVAQAPAQPPAQAPAQAPAVTENLPTIDQVLDKYVEALGGKAAIQKATSRVSKGTFEIPEFGASGTMTIYAKAPNKTAVIVDVPGFGVIKRGFDGTIGWEDNPQTGLTEQSGAALAATKRESAFHRELDLKAQYKQMEVKSKQKVGDQDVYTVIATPAEGPAETWYFDAATGLLARVDAERETPQGSALIQVSFKDYRDVEGVKTPFRIEQALPGMTITTKLEEVKQNVEVPDTQFAKP